MITASPSALGTEALYDILRTVRDFESFTPENDPFGEHDCALLEAAGQRIVFKIDYYDRQIQGTSPDPADPRLTCRVFTIALAHEY